MNLTDHIGHHLWTHRHDIGEPHERIILYCKDCADVALWIWWKDQK